MTEEPPTTPGPYEFLKSIETAEATLFLSFTSNLDFFERFALREVLRQQATAIVISDPAKFSGDPQLVSKAGLRYVPGFAVCGGGTAFHPKLILAVSSEQVAIAIGSGNLTLSGWHGNDELWTFVHATPQTCPSTVSDVGRFIGQLLDGRIRISSVAIDGLAKIAAMLNQWEPTHDGPRAVSSLDGPILNQLPAGPTSRLSVHSPFFDRSLEALDEVCLRLNPEVIDITLQKSTSVDGKALSKWAETHGANVRWASASPYRHGKLLEWLVDDRWNSLTGSPNLSGPALLHRVEAVGNVANCELGVISSGHPSLTPHEEPQSQGEPATLTFSSDSERRESLSVTILGATIGPGPTLKLELANPLPTEMRVQVHSPTKDWTTPETASTFAAGTREIVVTPSPLAAGAAVRLFGQDAVSNTAFVTDPVRTAERPMKWVGPDIKSFPEMLTNANFREIYKVADQIREQEAKLGVGTKKGPTQPVETNNEAPITVPTLAAHFEVASTVLSDEMLRWSLSLPPAGGSVVSSSDTTIQLSGETSDEDADAGSASGEETPESDAEAIRNATPHQRRSLRKFCEGALQDAGPWPNVARSFAARAVLNGCAGGLWDDEQMLSVLGRLVELLSSSSDIPSPEETQAVTAYLGIALAILRSSVQRLSVNDENSVRFRRAAEKARPSLGEVPTVQVNEMAKHLTGTFGDTVSSPTVTRVVSGICNPEDQMQRAIRLIREEAEVDVTLEDSAIRILDPLPTMFEHELLEIARFVRGPTATVLGHLKSGQPVALIWREPDLILLKKNPAGDWGRMYSGPAASPGTLIAGWNPGVSSQENLPKPTCDWFPGQPAPEFSHVLLEGIQAFWTDESPLNKR